MAVGSTDRTAATAHGGKNHCVLPVLEEDTGPATPRRYGKKRRCRGVFLALCIFRRKSGGPLVHGASQEELKRQ
ncbi:hypothetical protein GQ607_000084 [Colletotrichum asianum]|uniref:Uncharacterized protein n=1 Tax=Colletotrichum asianum TaxID=702518 RepID=A0A8H3WPY4_9PEZI|nr:hypothetical protein GQ607_000084 [Colletotrichum asianum]